MYLVIVEKNKLLRNLLYKTIIHNIFRCINAISSRFQTIIMRNKISIKEKITQHTVFKMLPYSMKCLSLMTKHEKLR